MGWRKSAEKAAEDKSWWIIFEWEDGQPPSRSGPYSFEESEIFMSDARYAVKSTPVRSMYQFHGSERAAMRHLDVLTAVHQMEERWNAEYKNLEADINEEYVYPAPLTVPATAEQWLKVRDDMRDLAKARQYALAAAKGGVQANINYETGPFRSELKRDQEETRELVKAERARVREANALLGVTP